MARNSCNLLELDVDKMFEDHKIEEILEIEKLLDAEIERKRVELRSMVGDRYKDVLAASDAIKNMKTISEQIVDNIQNITETCEHLIVNSSDGDVKRISNWEINSDERVLIVQVRLAIFMNEQIWTALDKGDNLTAAQFYLLAQHVHMGLSLSKQEYLQRVPLLKHIKANLQILKDQILDRITQKLEFVEITAEETSSNLNALMLLKNQSTSQLLNIFIEHRKIALNMVMNSSHASVRIQISAMVRCLITTIHLLHGCFMRYGDSPKGLIWIQLENIVEESSIPTLSKIELPPSPLNTYIPDIIKLFRPKYDNIGDTMGKRSIQLGEWLENTKLAVREGLEESLKLVTTVKGLHIIREEALKIELPNNWLKICSESNLPDGFNVWNYFFQNLITWRAKELISKNIIAIFRELQTDITNTRTGGDETDLRIHTWADDASDVSRLENKHRGLSMKTLGYSQNIVALCQKLDKKYLELLVDLSQYLYGKEFDEDHVVLTHLKNKKKFVDRDELESHIRSESTKVSTELTVFLEHFVKGEHNQIVFVRKSLMCARLLQAVITLCPHFNKCCCFNGTEDWSRVCNHFDSSGLQFWENWVERCVQEADKRAKIRFSEVSIASMISLLLRWDAIEIQEETEEKVFKSQIKVPLKPSLLLDDLLAELNSDLDCVLPHTLPKQIHLRFIEKNVEAILKHYNNIAEQDLNQKQSLQFLFDVKFLATFCIPRENGRLVTVSQEICDKLRAKIDPFDLDVFYSHLQNNIKRAVLQAQAILGCLLPASAQLANLGESDKSKEQEKDPSVLALSVPSIAFPLFCTYVHHVPAQKVAVAAQPSTKASPVRPTKAATPKKSQDPAAAIRSSAAALFGGLTTDWFS